MLPTPADLAPGDGKSVGLDISHFDIRRIRSIDDPWFESAYRPLWTEFGVKNEMERRTTLAARFALAPEMLYEMVLMETDGAFAAVRDHTVIPAASEVVVHLSHNLVAPAFRRSGLAGWMRAMPILTARAFRPGAAVTLVAEMEQDDLLDEARGIRLRAYEKAGFSKVDPSRVKYHQPDFREPMVIDASRRAQPVSFQLVLRRVDREGDTSITGGELHRIVQALYKMYGALFRAGDMAHSALDLSGYPADYEVLRLLPPTQ